MPNITIKKKTLEEVQPKAKEIVIKHKVGKSQVVAVFDISGSMEGMYRAGVVDALATRVLALGLELDDNGEIPVYVLNNGVQRLDDLTKANWQGYTQKIHRLVGGGTNYAPTIKKVVDDAEAGDSMLVLLFTDGDNYDHEEAENAIAQASNLPIFFQWYGIYRGKQASSFPFLERLNDLADSRNDLKIDNCGFSLLGLEMTTSDNGDDHDTALYEDMLKEYKDFPEKAKAAGVVWGNKRRKFLGIF